MADRLNERWRAFFRYGVAYVAVTVVPVLALAAVAPTAAAAIFGILALVFGVFAGIFGEDMRAETAVHFGHRKGDSGLDRVEGVESALSSFAVVTYATMLALVSFVLMIVLLDLYVS